MTKIPRRMVTAPWAKWWCDGQQGLQRKLRERRVRSSADESVTRENLEHAGLAGWCPGCASVPRGSARQAHTENFWRGTVKAEAAKMRTKHLPGQGSREEAEEDEARSRRRRGERAVTTERTGEDGIAPNQSPGSGSDVGVWVGSRKEKSLCGSSRGLRARARSPSCIGHSTFHFSRKKKTVLAFFCHLLQRNRFKPREAQAHSSSAVLFGVRAFPVSTTGSVRERRASGRKTDERVVRTGVRTKGRTGADRGSGSGDRMH